MDLTQNTKGSSKGITLGKRRKKNKGKTEEKEKKERRGYIIYTVHDRVIMMTELPGALPPGPHRGP